MKKKINKALEKKFFHLVIKKRNILSINTCLIDKYQFGKIHYVAIWKSHITIVSYRLYERILAFMHLTLISTSIFVMYFYTELYHSSFHRWSKFLEFMCMYLFQIYTYEADITLNYHKALTSKHGILFNK